MEKKNYMTKICVKSSAVISENSDLNVYTHYKWYFNVMCLLELRSVGLITACKQDNIAILTALFSFLRL